MKQLYATLEDKEKELREFIRAYEKVSRVTIPMVHFFFFFVVCCVVSLSVIKDDDDFPEGVQEK